MTSGPPQKFPPVELLLRNGVYAIMTIASVQWLLLLVAASPAVALDDDSAMNRGRKAISAGDYAAAADIYRAALAHAETTVGAQSGVIDALHGLSDVARLQGQSVEAEALLSRAVVEARKQDGDASLPVAGLLSELAAVQRSRSQRKQALATLEQAIRIREGHTGAQPEDLARDVSSAALLQVALGDAKAAKTTLARALALWSTAAAPDAPQLLPLLDALGAIHRDNAEYAEAEPIYQRALLIRESLLGPDSSELLSTVDSLAYVYFGQKKLAEAEPVYRRLLQLWEASVGPDHPMVALTLDKMAEFLAAQQRYDEAEVLALRARAIRTSMHMASLNQTGRLLLMQSKIAEAEDLYRRAIEAGDLSHAPSESLDPLLRVYAKLLRERGHPKEADAMEKRARDAVIDKGEREGRRPSPVQGRM
jgi:tetratricopeptide (TPR) repeat protein